MIKLQVDKNKSSQFGAMAAALAFVVSIYLWSNGVTDGALGLALTSQLLWFISVFSSQFYTTPCYYWLRLGSLLARLIQPVVLYFLYYLVVTPFGMVGRMFGRDVLLLKSGNGSWCLSEPSNTRVDMDKPY